ncbi:MAG: HAD-IIIC family phosphatase [Clostridiales bacterium]|nr:HAD-IIIC family phosphatase [Clostridiales bacterium]
MKSLSYLQLKKNCARTPETPDGTRFALLGDCATQLLATAIRGYALEMNLPLRVFEADYDQIDAQLMDTGSEFYAFAPETVLLYRCTEKLYERFVRTPLDARAAFAETEIEKIRAEWARVQHGTKADILFFAFLPMDDGVFGSYALREGSAFPYQLLKLNYLLAEAAREAGNVRLIDLEPIRAHMGYDAFHDPKLYAIAKMPISTQALPAVASRVMDAILARKGRFHKCAIVDLDNTLWGGVIGDDGLEGIQIGELGQGHAFTEFQTWLKELKNRGVMLAVCSKNDEANAKEPFLRHPEMVLKLDDFSAFVANWEDKASNIRRIQKELNIGLDSMVFFDDNPFERNLVRTMLPEVEVPELPEDPAEYTAFARMQNLFDTNSYSDEDRVRTERYLAEKSRTELSAGIDNYDDYLKALGMKAVCAPFDAFHIPRIAQLTQRSNQFNLRTVRYSEQEIEEIAANPRYVTRYYTLRDRFGEHGLIAVVILEKRENELFVNEWLMSCRVLKRGMEQFIADSILRAAREAGVARVVGEYIPTPKNAMVKDLYASMGFRPLGDGLYEARVNDYRNHQTFITEEEAK